MPWTASGHRSAQPTPDVEITRLNAGSYEPGSLAMNVSPSLFGERKLIEVEGRRKP